MVQTVSTVPVLCGVLGYLWAEMFRGGFLEVGPHLGLQRWVGFELVEGLGERCFKGEEENEHNQKEISSM